MSQPRRRRKPGGATRRQTLKQLFGGAAAIPMARLLPAPPEAPSGNEDPFLGLGVKPAAAPAPQKKEPPKVWQPPYQYEPPLPANAVVLPILMYHRATLARLFEAQLLGMIRAGYTPLSLHDALTGLRGEWELPAKPLVLTFDDGWNVQFNGVFPVLRDYKIPGTFFVMPGFHERQEGYMDWDQLGAIAEAGLNVESHTLNHADLPWLAKKDWGAVLAEVVISKQRLEERLGQTPRYFDYPLGRQNARIRQVVQEAGYEAAVTIGPGVHQSAETLYTMRRIRVEAWEPWSSVQHQLAWYGA